MKLIRFGKDGAESPGLQLSDGSRIDTSGFGMDWNEGFFGDPSNFVRLKKWVDSNAATAPKVGKDVRLGPCVARPGKLICIGLNYSDHAAESGMPIPEQPIVFFKATSAICGPNDNLVIPPGSLKTDWETGQLRE